jgi:NADPH:quinone reductase-like Zn-dependent oxidoreductase
LLGEHLPGTLAEFVVVPDANVFTIPTPPDPHPPISWPEAAAFGLVTLTALRMVVTQARVQPGEVVLIWGIGGGVSLTALTIAKLVGASVIATSSSDDKLAVAKEMGADITLNHREVDVAGEVRRATNKRGADVVIENVGEATWEASLRALAKRGRLVTCGATTGPKVVSTPSTACNRGNSSESWWSRSPNRDRGEGRVPSGDFTALDQALQSQICAPHSVQVGPAYRYRSSHCRSSSSVRTV